MDLSKLSQNEKLAVYGAGALIITGIVAAATYSFYGLSWLAVIAALGLLFVVLQPQIAPGVTLPGSKGSLMLLLGGIAGVLMVLAFLVTIGIIFVNFGLADIMFLAAVVAAVVAAWAGWREFQAEGGQLKLGAQASGPTTTSATAPAPEPMNPAAAAPPASEPMESAAAAEPAAAPEAPDAPEDDPYRRDDDEDRPTA